MDTQNAHHARLPSESIRLYARFNSSWDLGCLRIIGIHHEIRDKTNFKNSDSHVALWMARKESKGVCHEGKGSLMGSTGSSLCCKIMCQDSSKM